MTISVCMIVKNEEDKLFKCLECLKPIADEIVIVDTGSTDGTKDVAKQFTDRIYDFKWTGDFSEARNFAFSFATCDYIYTADADELLDENNIREFKRLKASLLPEVEIVQMHYLNPPDRNMAYNDLDELRPKLFKRLRTFTWIDPIHETVRLLPVVFDSEIRIIHDPDSNHASRDFKAFLRVLRENDGKMSDRLFSMYAKELFFSGTKEDFAEARPFFEKRTEELCDERYLEALCVMAVATVYTGTEDQDLIDFEKEYRNFCLRPAEIDVCLSHVFERNNDPEKAEEYRKRSKEDEWFVRAGFELQK